MAKGPRLKGKARKLAKDVSKESMVSLNQPPKASASAPKYTVTTGELLGQVKLVADSKTSRMPKAIRNALVETIKARQRCSTWFEKTSTIMQESLDGHRYFIEVLQHALSQLTVKSATDVPAATEGAKPDAKDEKDLIFMRNIFQALELEDVSDAEIEDSTPPRSAPSSQPDQAYELEVDPNTELTFKIFSLFEDLHRLRVELRIIWKRFHDEQMSLLQVSLLTSAALEIVLQAEADVYEAYSISNKASEHTYKDLAGLIYASDALDRAGEEFVAEPSIFEILEVEVKDIRKIRDMIFNDRDDLAMFSSSKFLEIPSFDEFILLPTGRILLRLAAHKPMLELWQWPYSIPTERINYVERPELLGDARIQKFLEQDEFLSQIFLDMAWRTPSDTRAKRI